VGCYENQNQLSDKNLLLPIFFRFVRVFRTQGHKNLSEVSFVDSFYAWFLTSQFNFHLSGFIFADGDFFSNGLVAFRFDADVMDAGIKRAAQR